MRISFEELCQRLATDAGGYTLWIGAGASIASTRGRTPGWNNLISEIRAAYGFPELPTAQRAQVRLPRSDMPDQLEFIASKIGHPAFRKELRKRLVESFSMDDIDIDVIAAQAIIGARASAIVSFNIELFSGLSFIAARGGTSVIVRTFRERREFGVVSSYTVHPGLVSTPIYFPHGLLDQANLVITKSEYDKHRGSLAVTTAVHLCLGGDLVILGMSLADEYLRRAILKNRRWIRDVYWIGAECSQVEWARVAEVTFVKTPHDVMWRELARCIIDHDSSDTLRKQEDELRKSFPDWMSRVMASSRRIQEQLENHAKRLLKERPALPPAKIIEFARLCIDLGLEIPKQIRNDDRCRL
jgi:hypothetical protein